MDTIVIFQYIWYILIGVLLFGYSILDGFDLGIGSLLPLLAKNESEKRTLFNAVGPFWDGNEVWLLTGGGALFAAFPHAYATVFSGFYLALMLVLFALIFRAIALEFWNYDTDHRKFWEWAFIIGSFLPALLYGVALGNVIIGVPLDAGMEFRGNFFTLLRPFPLIIGLLGLIAFFFQGSSYAALKTEGELQVRARKLILKLWIPFIVLFGLSLALALVFRPKAVSNWLAWIIAVLVIVVWLMLKNAVRQEQDAQTFTLSSVLFAGLWGLVGVTHFPHLVVANNDPSHSLTIFNASSSALTLKVMLIIALIGMPFVIGYTIYAYKVFKGKVVVNEAQ